MSMKRSKPFEASTPGNSSAGLVDIGGGRKMYLECQGTGTPTVVLVPGLVAAADIWSYVMDTSHHLQTQQLRRVSRGWQVHQGLFLRPSWNRERGTATR